MMPTIDIERFLPAMRTYVRNVPEPVAERFVRAAAREFCRITRIWRDICELTVEEALITLSCTIADARILEIEHASIDGAELTPKAPSQLDDVWPGWSDVDAQPGAAKYITQLGGNTISLVPRQAGTIRMRIVLIPSDDALNLPEILLDEHSETIGIGAASKAMLVPGTEYTNPAAAAGLSQNFISRANTERWRVAKTKPGARLRTKPNYF